MVTYMSPLGGTCTRASQDGLTYSCSMYTSPTNVPEESAESFVSFEADTENIPGIGLLTSLISSQVPFLPGRNLSSVPYILVAVHTWLLIVEPDLTYVVYQQSTDKCPYLGNIPVSLFSYVHGDIDPKYTLGILKDALLEFHLQFHARASPSSEFCRLPSTYLHV